MSSKDNINDATGEVIDSSSVVSTKRPIIFKNMWSNPYPLVYQDLSNEFEEVFEEVEPFALDAETGKLLNPSSQPMLVSKGKINVQEKIQSYADQADIYKVLEKYAASGDSSLLSAMPCAYGDISDLPNDLNSYAQYVRNHFKALDDMNPDLAKMVIDDKKYSSADIEAKAKEIYDARVASLKNDPKEKESEVK